VTILTEFPDNCSFTWECFIHLLTAARGLWSWSGREWEIHWWHWSAAYRNDTTGSRLSAQSTWAC